MSTPFEIFISTSSAPEDVDLCTRLDAVLTTVIQDVEVWHRGRAVDAKQGAEETATRLARAQVILLLVSFDFLTSASCKAEVAQAMARHETGEVRVVPVLARACTFERQPFAGLRPLPMNGVPVTSWPVRDEALQDVVEAIRRMPRPRDQS